LHHLRKIWFRYLNDSVSSSTKYPFVFLFAFLNNGKIIFFHAYLTMRQNDMGDVARRIVQKTLRGGFELRIAHDYLPKLDFSKPSA